MTPRVALFACAIRKYRERHRKLPSCRDQELGANFFTKAKPLSQLFTQSSICTNRRQKLWSVQLLPENGRYQLSTNSDQSRHRPWGGVTDECRPGGPAGSVVRRIMEVVADGIGGRSRRTWAARERAADDWHRRVQRR